MKQEFWDIPHLYENEDHSKFGGGASASTVSDSVCHAKTEVAA